MDCLLFGLILNLIAFKDLLTQKFMLNVYYVIVFKIMIIYF